MTVDTRDRAGRTPLIYACADGDIDKARALLAAGADVNAQDVKGLTPLHSAAQHGYTEIVALLLDAGADIDAFCDGYDGNVTPLWRACRRLDESTAALMLARGADPNARNRWGSVPLNLSFMRGSRFDPVDPIVTILVEHGADPHLRNSDGQTPHISAATNERPDICAAMGVDYNPDRLPCCGYRPRKRRK